MESGKADGEGNLKMKGVRDELAGGKSVQQGQPAAVALAAVTVAVTVTVAVAVAVNVTSERLELQETSRGGRRLPIPSHSRSLHSLHSLHVAGVHSARGAGVLSCASLSHCGRIGSGAEGKGAGQAPWHSSNSTRRDDKRTPSVWQRCA